MGGGIGFADGVLFRDGSPELWLSAEYAYHREDSERWQDGLRELKGLGLPSVTLAVPWRHHGVGGEWDFDGRTRPDRNLVRLLKLVQAEGLLAVIKVGPFIGAGAEFGGLPDDAAGGVAYEALLDRSGLPRLQDGRPLPAPLDRHFSARALAWLQACLEHAVFPYCYPDGPVIALQLLDESGLPDAGLLASDYSDAGLAAYRRRHGSAALPPVSFSPPEAVQEVLPYLWWGRHQSGYLAEVYRRFGLPLEEAGLPVYVHHRAAAPEELEHWLTRTGPERWVRVRYGFSWSPGSAAAGLEALAPWLLAGRRRAGPNLDLDWSRDAGLGADAFFDTVLAIAAGATGCSLRGVRGAGRDALRLLATYLSRYGGEMVTARRAARVTWALYPPYAALAAGSDRPEDWADLGVKPPRCGNHALLEFARTMRLESRDFGIVNLEESGRLDPAEHPCLLLCGGFLMDRAAQQNLLLYVRRGGTLILAQEWPVLNDQLEICTILRDGVEANPGQGLVRFLEENPFEAGPAESFLRLLDDLGFPAPLATDSPETQAWVLKSESGAEHYILLSPGEAAGVRQAGPVSVRLPGRSAALVRVLDGRLTAALVKGVRGDGADVAPMAACGGVMVAADSPCDLLWVAEGDLRMEVNPAPSGRSQSAPDNY